MCLFLSSLLCGVRNRGRVLAGLRLSCYVLDLTLLYVSSMGDWQREGLDGLRVDWEKGLGIEMSGFGDLIRSDVILLG